MTRVYTWFVAVFLLLQGGTTLAARVLPAVDATFPALLLHTQMMPSHSLLHIATAVVASVALRWGRSRGVFVFALSFGIFYIGLAVAGIVSGLALGLGLQPFDHPFHLLLGGLGVVAAGLDQIRGRSGSPARSQAGGRAATVPKRGAR